LRSIFSLSYDDLFEYIESNNFEKFRAKQIIEWLYKKKVVDFDSMKNLPKNVISKLKTDFVISSLNEIERKKSIDGTTKIIYKTFDNNIIETVVIPNNLNKYTICISTQVGCPIGCSFCATGINGFKRNLNIDEIISQFYLNSKDVSNIVLMGMGEPFLNPDIWEFLNRMTSVDYFNFSSRSITVSTVGIIDGIKKLVSFNKQIKLAVSYHSGVSETRKILFPKIYDIIDFKKLIKALKDFSKTGKRFTLEYILIKDLNDNKKEAEILNNLSREIDFHLNIIPYNSHKFANYKSPDDIDISRFISYLNNVKYTIRKSKGQDISGACGQLAGEKSIIYN